MSKKSIATARGEKLYSNLLKKPANLPFSFSYDGVCHKGLGDFHPRRHIEATESGEKLTITAKVDDVLYVTVKAQYNREFGESEYTVWLENRGRKPSGVITELCSLDAYFDGRSPVLRGCLGDHDNFYAAYEHDLEKSDKYFFSRDGRSCHIVFPYFDLVHGDGGTMLALGWAGTWDAVFSAATGRTHVKAKTDLDIRTVLLPGEKLRTALVVMLPYRGRDYDNASNLWREWFMKYNAPKADGSGAPLRPFSTCFWALDTGLPNSDGSVSERYFTWKPTLEKQLSEGLKTDFRWFDAGWYTDPYGKTIEWDWWGTVGTWELDPVKWPGKTFLESNEACHKAGMKVFVWFEPERVTNIDGLAANYGYKPEWAIGEGNSRTNDLGNPECLAWTMDRIIRMMDENGVDMYREDNNTNPGDAWPRKDRMEAERLGLPRAGITENKCICGHYALWDGILEYCRKNGKCTFLDSCASGGGRNDIESMRRGIPVMRSDFDRQSSSMRLAQTSTLPRWIPFHGSSTSEPAHALAPDTGICPSVYVTRASLLPLYNMMNASFTQNKNLDFDGLRRNLNEWKSVCHLLTKDFYVLTPWHHASNREGWSAFAYDDPEKGESILLAFRLEESPIGEMTLKLPFAEKDAVYTLRDADTDRTWEETGSTLLKGIRITLSEPKSSALIRIGRKSEQER